MIRSSRSHREDRHRRMRPASAHPWPRPMTGMVTRSSSWTVRRSAFDRLSSSFGGRALRGDGTDEDVLRRAGAEEADLFLAMTEGDNRNIMATQLAKRGPGYLAGHRQDQRPGAGQGLRGARHRHAVPDRPDVRRHRPLPRAAPDRAAGHARPDRPSRRPRADRQHAARHDAHDPVGVPHGGRPERERRDLRRHNPAGRRPRTTQEV